MVRDNFCALTHFAKISDIKIVNQKKASSYNSFFFCLFQIKILPNTEKSHTSLKNMSILNWTTQLTVSDISCFKLSH